MAERTCELRAWRGRPLSAPRGGGRGPGRPLTPRSLARSITHTRAQRLLPASTRRRERRVASVGKEQRDKHPPPRAGTHRRTPKHNLERPRQFQGPRRARSRNTWKASPGPAPKWPAPRGEAGPAKAEPLARSQTKPASLEARRHFPGSLRPESALQGRLRRACPEPGSPSPQFSARTSPGQRRRTGTRPEAQAAVSLSNPHGLRPRMDGAQSGAPNHRCRRLRALLRVSPLHAGSAPAVGRGLACGAYLSVVKCPGGFLPV